MQAPAAKAGTVTEELPLFYVRDAQGRLVPLLGFKYEELLQFVQEKKAAGEKAIQRPRYSLEQLVCTGEVQEGRAKFAAVYTVRVEDAQWVEVPLVGKGAVLPEPAQYEGSGEHALRFDVVTQTYAVRLRGAPRSEHKISFQFLAPIRTPAGEQRLEFELAAAAASRLSLRVPETPIELTSHTGAAEAEIKPVNDGSQIEMWGLGGRLTIGWKKTDPRQARSAPALEATGQVLARIDSHSARFDAVLSVRSRGAAFDRLHIKLPPGAQFLGSERAEAGYTVTAASEAPQQVLDVQLAEKTLGPLQIRVQAERAYDVTRPDESLDLAGFEVIESLPHRQWGHIAVAVVGDWQVTWGKRNRVRQVDELPRELEQKDVVARFEYFGQPASLTARIAPRKTRISVEPQYVYFVEPHQVRLEARLRYAIRGAKAFSLDVELPGWEIDELGPASAVDTESGLSGGGAVMSVPLMDTTIGDVELTIRAHRDLAADASRVEFTLPVPRCDVQGPAVVAVLPADNVRLRPREAELEGLIRPSVAPHIALPAAQQTPLFYRGERAQAKFVAEIEQLPQTVSAAVENNVDLRREEVRVEQLLSYRVQHEPAASLLLDVPRTLLADSKVVFFVDGKEQSVHSQPDEAGDAALARVELPLGSPRIGAVDVVASFRLPQVMLSPITQARLEVPLVMPAKTSLNSNQLRVSAETGIRWEANDEAWVLPADPLSDLGANRATVPLSADHFVPSATLDLMLDRRGPRTTIVDRAWLQTWLSNGVRQDRAVYRFKSTEEELQVTLPAGVQGLKVEARFDGQLLASSEAKGMLNIKLPVSRTGLGHVLELRYQIEGDAASSGAVDVNFPLIEGNVWVQRMYWQLVLPQDRHLLSAPDEFTPEFTWEWNGIVLIRRAAWDQADLESWAGAAAEPPLPQATNRYLFSATDSLRSASVRLAPRWQIVFLGSLGALAAGLLFIYVPAARQPGVVFAAGIGLFALTAWHPDSTLLVAQAALLGIVLAVLAGILRRAIVRRHARGMVVRSPESSIIERDSTRKRLRTTDSIARPASDVLPATLEASTSDSKNN